MIFKSALEVDYSKLDYDLVFTSPPYYFIQKYMNNAVYKTKKEISPALAELIPALMQDHSWYVQQLAHYTWQKTKKKATKAEIQMAFYELIDANTPLYMREVEGLSLTQLNFLKAGHQIDWRGWSRVGHDQTGHKSLKTQKMSCKNGV